MDKLKLVKTAVFILTFLLFFGIISAGMLIYQKASAKANLSEINLNLPTGSRIKHFNFHDGQIYLLIKSKHQADQLITVNPNTAEITATIKAY